jgi:hypothetical protein
MLMSHHYNADHIRSMKIAALEMRQGLGIWEW